MSKVKICLIHHLDPLGMKIGGITTFIKGFIKHAPEDFDIKMIGVTSNPVEISKKRWHSLIQGKKRFDFYPIFAVKNENIRPKIPLSFKFVMSLLSHNFDIDNQILFFHRIELVLPFIFSKNKKIIVIHTDVLEGIKKQNTENKWKYIPKVFFTLEKFVINKIKKLYIVNKNSIKHYLSTYPHIKDRIEFLPTWADAEIFSPLSDAEKKREKSLFLQDNRFNIDDKLIVFVGRFEFVKNPLLLLDSFHYVSMKNKRIRLILIGEGGLRKKMENKIDRLGISDKILFMGTLPQERVSKILQISDLFLLTSAFEGMPLSVLEALATGLPVVTTNAGEVKLVIKDGFSGRVVKEHTSWAIGDAVLEVLNRKNYSKENCLSSVADFSPQRVLKSVYEYFAKINE